MAINRVAAITGAASGLGKIMALALLERGYKVAAIDRDLGGLQRLMRECSDGSLALHIFESDLSLPSAADVISRIEEELGAIDILINNAGLGQGQIRPDYHVNSPRFYEIEPEQWQRALAVNASAVFLLSRAVAEGMIERGWGRIINITTSLGTMLRGGWTPYGPTKASAEALSAVMAADLEQTGVTVNVIVPGGVVDTPMVPSEAPFKRAELIRPEVMLPPLMWLLSDEASHVTGQRYLGIKWDPSLDQLSASKEAGAPIGWRDLAVLPVRPEIPTL